MMKKIFTFFLGALMCTSLMAQNTNNEAVIQKAGDVVPVIDGEIDDVWADVTQNNIIRPFGTEVPTMGAEGETYYKMLWSDAGLYILIVANDDVWYPYTGTGDAYTFDKIELYFDTNDILDDAVGGQAGTTGNRQIAPDPKLTALDGTMQTSPQLGGEYNWAYKLNDPAWTTEWFIPWECIPNKDGLNFEKTNTMGFDVDVTDNDNDGAGRKRLMWSNDATFGANNENWNNMDAAGHLTFEGAEAVIVIDNITISGASEITTDGGTLKLTAALDPVDATQPYIWQILEGTEFASIDKKTGLITAKKDGVIKVVAMSADLFVQSNEMSITISGQILGAEDMWTTFNLISNWNFSEDQLTASFPPKWGGWVDTGAAGTEGQLNPKTVDGVVEMQCGIAEDGANWHYQLNQNNLTAQPDVEYTLKFKSWASADNTACAVDFEDTSDNSYTRYGATSDPESGDGRSEWHYTVGTEPTWFTFHVTFDKIIATTVQKIQWMNSISNEKVYLDSVLLIKSTDIISKAELAHTNLMKIYPNPVGAANELTVLLTSENAKVAVYNSIGQKMMEKMSTGNMAKFNVATLRKGVYFVRLEDGTTTKFIK